MPRRPTRTVPTVLLAGPAQQSADWQCWLSERLVEAGREVRLPRPAHPESAGLSEWLPALREGLETLPADGYDVIAHSVSCLLWMHHALDPQGCPRPARVALIAPPAPSVAATRWPSFYPVPLQVDALRKAADGTVLVGGAGDPDCPDGVALTYGAPLKMAATVVADGTRLTAESGYGSWPAVLDWCGRDNLAFIA